MTTDHILVRREFEGERCVECRLGVDSLCVPFDATREADEAGHFYLRCPACLAQPAAEVLTEEGREAVEGACGALEALTMKAGYSDNMWVKKLRAAFPWLEG